MKNILMSILACALLLFANPANAISAKIITLKDGSTLKGNVLELSRGVYKIKTQTLGIMEINQDDISSIATERMHKAHQAETQESVSVAPVVTQANLTAQVEKVQSQIMGNPAMMAEIQTLMNDPQIMDVIADPEFMQKIMKLDLNSIQDNPDFKKLLDNPKMRSLINQLQSK